MIILNVKSLYNDKNEDKKKKKMSLAGVKIDEKTDTAIKNMKSYLNNLNKKDRSDQSLRKRFLFAIGRSEENKVRKKFKLEDINKFADMPELIQELSEKEKLIDLTVQEKNILNGLLPYYKRIKKNDKKTKKDDKNLVEKTKPNTIGRIREIVDFMQKRDTVENRAITDKKDILKIAFEMLYPSKNVNDLIERYEYITNKDNFQFDLFDDMNISELADDKNFNKIKENGKEKMTVTKKFNEKYKELLQNIKYGKLKDLMNNKIKAKLKEKLQQGLNTIKITKYNNNVIKKNIDNNLDIPEEKSKEKVIEEIEKKLKEKDLEQYGASVVYLPHTPGVSSTDLRPIEQQSVKE